MRSLPVWMMLALLCAVPCACNKGNKGNKGDKGVNRPAVNGPADDGPADDGDFLEPVYLPGGVADDNGAVGYLANPKGGIDAVDLESGKLLWHTDAASYPLIVHKDALLAQDSLDADAIRVVTLHVAQKGKLGKASDPIQLHLTAKEMEDIRKKELITPAAEPDIKHRVTTFCRGKIQQGALHLIWRSSFFRFTAEIDMATGKVTKARRTRSERLEPSIKDYSEIAKIATDPRAFGVPQKLPELAKLEDPQPRDLFAFHIGYEKQRLPIRIESRWVAGDVLAVLMHVASVERSRKLLVLWDMKTGKNLFSGEVLSNDLGRHARDRHGVVYPAFHGRYVVHLYRYDGFPDGKAAIPVKAFSLENRKWSPTVGLSPEADNIMVAGSRLFFTSKDTLKAVDLPKQETQQPAILWERAVLLPIYALPTWDDRREPREP